MYHLCGRDNAFQNFYLHCGEFFYFFRTKSYPVQPQIRIVHRYGRRRRGYLFERIILLTPENSTVNFVKLCDIPVFFFKPRAETRYAFFAPAYVASLVSQFVIYLPGDYCLFVAVMFGKLSDYAPGTVEINFARITTGMSAAVRSDLSVFKLRNDFGISLYRPCRRGRRRSAENYFKSSFLCFILKLFLTHLTKKYLVLILGKKR